MNIDKDVMKAVNDAIEQIGKQKAVVVVNAGMLDCAPILSKETGQSIYVNRWQYRHLIVVQHRDSVNGKQYKILHDGTDTHEPTL